MAEQNGVFSNEEENNKKRNWNVICGVIIGVILIVTVLLAINMENIVMGLEEASYRATHQVDDKGKDAYIDGAKGYIAKKYPNVNAEYKYCMDKEDDIREHRHYYIFNDSQYGEFRVELTLTCYSSEKGTIEEYKDNWYSAYYDLQIKTWIAQALNDKYKNCKVFISTGNYYIGGGEYYYNQDDYYARAISSIYIMTSDDSINESQMTKDLQDAISIPNMQFSYKSAYIFCKMDQNSNYKNWNGQEALNYMKDHEPDNCLSLTQREPNKTSGEVEA